MRFFQRLTRRSATRHSRHPGQPPASPALHIDVLEARELLSTAQLLSGGLLAITATGARSNIQVIQDPVTSDLVVWESGQAIGDFAPGQVTAIAVTGTNGSNNIHIARNVTVPVQITGGTGQNALLAGSGPTALLGGQGTNKLIGGSGTDLLVGGTGYNTLISRSPTTALTAGPGLNQVQAVPGNTVAQTQPTDRVSGVATDPPADPPADTAVLTPDEVNTLLQRAAAATPSDDFIVAVVDREGNILGVRVEGNVSPQITSNNATLTFAIDGAVALARTGAFFANDQAPLTSRTVQFISQSTITQREVDSNPDLPDPNSPLWGPGLVAPIGIESHFPPDVPFTPQVDLFDIEQTNRDSIINAGPDHIRGTADDVKLPSRFNVPLQYIPPGQNIPAPESYGLVSGLDPSAQARGIGTLPGGIPIYKDGQLVGGIGVFYPGTTGYASAENSALDDATYNPALPDKSLEAEFIGLAAVGGSSALDSCMRGPGAFKIGTLGGVPALPGFDIPVIPPGRIDLMGVTLDLFGPGGRNGPDVLLNEGNQLGIGTGNPYSGVNEPVVVGGMASNPALTAGAQNGTLLGGTAVPTGWLVTPHDGVGITAAQVTQIIDQGIATAQRTRAQIRLPLNSNAEMVFAVTDKTGAVLGLYRMPDATYFSIDVAVAKARNVAYYADPNQLQPIDQVPGIPPGVAFTNRTFRYLAQPRFPEGIDGAPPGPFSILNAGNTDINTGATIGAPLPPSAYTTTVEGNNAFYPNTNFHQPWNPNQNGIVFFPGSSPVYIDGQLVGGLGVSGDGVDEDDVVTSGAIQGYAAEQNGVPRADQYFFQGVRLPYQNFDRNPYLH